MDEHKEVHFHTTLDGPFLLAREITRLLYLRQQVEWAVRAIDFCFVVQNVERRHESLESRNARKNQDQVAVKFKHGWNTLLAKVSNQEGFHALYLQISNDPVAIAKAYGSAGKWDEALAVWSRLIEKNPDNIQLRLARARVFIKAGREEEAMSDFAFVTNRNSVDATGLVIGMARQDFRVGNFQEAIDVLTAALSSNPDNIPLLAERVERAGRLARWQIVSEDLLRLVDLDPTDHLTAMKFGAALAKLRNLDDYQRYIKTMIEARGSTTVRPVPRSAARVDPGGITEVSRRSQTDGIAP